MPLKKESSADYDQGTGKVKTRSEQQAERTYVAPAVEPSGRVEQNTEPVTTQAIEEPAKPRKKAVQDAENKSVSPKAADKK